MWNDCTIIVTINKNKEEYTLKYNSIYYFHYNYEKKKFHIEDYETDEANYSKALGASDDWQEEDCWRELWNADGGVATTYTIHTKDGVEHTLSSEEVYYFSYDYAKKSFHIGSYDVDEANYVYILRHSSTVQHSEAGIN